MRRPIIADGALVRFHFGSDQARICFVDGYIKWTPVAEGDCWIIEVAPDREKHMYIQRFIYMEILEARDE